MTRRRAAITAVCALCLALALAPEAGARNVDISTLPGRDWAQLTIYNGEDLTLVREMRSLTLKKGLNRIQYAWAGTLIDPTSLDLRATERQEEIEILDTTFLGDKPQHCIWNIDSAFEGQVQFVVTYFTSGIRWSADYVAISDPGETEMSFDGYVQVYNFSGEEYDNAEVRLVVGVVNLVEKIAELARQGLPPRPGTPKYDKLRAQAMHKAITTAERAEADQKRAPEIIKEGLSEYFLYTVKGRQTVPDGWSKRMLSFRARQVPFDILYRMRAHQYGPRPIRFFMMLNDAEHKMGTTPLPNGLVRVFRDNGRDGLSYLCEQSIPYVPIKEDIELRVGTDDEVVYERACMDVMRNNWAFGPHGAVVGYDEWRDMTERIRNYKGKPIRMEIRHILDGDFELDLKGARVHDYHTVEVTLDVKARATLDWQYKQLQHVGANQRQKHWIQLKEKLTVR